MMIWVYKRPGYPRGDSSTIHTGVYRRAIPSRVPWPFAQCLRVDTLTVIAMLTCFLVILSGCSFGLGSAQTNQVPGSSPTPTVSNSLNLTPQPTVALTD
ncbi:MAG TPA: hypothetical protein VKR42_13710, partial [Ktedonobacteraceae bacterium]|nr:hypothetical protein [Ktedonobacteraceae bacterium]